MLEAISYRNTYSERQHKTCMGLLSSDMFFNKTAMAQP